MATKVETTIKTLTKDYLKKLSDEAKKGTLSIKEEGKAIKKLNDLLDQSLQIQQKKNEAKLIEIKLQKELNIAKAKEAAIDRKKKLEPIQYKTGLYKTRNVKELTRYKNLASIKDDNDRAMQEAKYELSDAKLSMVNNVISNIASIAKTINNSFKQIFGISLSIRDTFSDIINKIGNTLNPYSGASSYNLGSSLTSNYAARSQAFKYGLSSSSNYALTKTAGILFGSTNNLDENLALMNSSQRSLYVNLMQSFGSWYNKLESSGTLESVQRMQLDFQIFREELSMDFLEWFSENKDTILGAIKVTASVLKSIMNGIATLLRGLHLGDAITMSDSTLSAAMANAKNVNISIKQDNNFSGNASTDVMSATDQSIVLFKQAATAIS